MNYAAQPVDYWWVAAGAVAMTVAMLAAWRAVAATHRSQAAWQFVQVSLTDTALLLVALGIALRWVRLGHGPFLNMFEILASSLFSLGVAWRVTHLRVQRLRDIAPMVLTLLAVLAAWLLVVDPADTHLPATYEMTVLWFHVALGKVFLGCALVATGIAGVVLARATRRGRLWFERVPGDAVLDALVWRFMMAALVFESLMLVAGAVWAQDAWGRYWAWDPLETWAFVTWLTLAGAIHARLAWRVAPRVSALMIVGVFAIAFLTFFGVPFISTAPHKGAV
ncbi:cytochrome c biogenesis protein [Ramlibacter albus]|uniref:Cytochrome c biogenesis protein CcsA n=1 Tax=Ramlibacter albus TaxID=2079448 RepID=A0A923M751_9BURK|nr:cytochrome c biogenesis protein CcsA [Ramlibacter albus]MBC5764036.1 cytochrome c biogenesis protein CcsA [Ramlibacter albus]